MDCPSCDLLPQFHLTLIERTSIGGRQERRVLFEGRFDCDRDDVAGALPASIDLFRHLTAETAERLRLPYPRVADERATALAMEALKGDV